MSMTSFLKIFIWGMLWLLAVNSSHILAADKGTERVRIAVSSKSLGFFDVWAAHQKGIHRKHGLDSEIISMRPPLSIAALQAGEIDYSFGISTVIRAGLAGLPVKVVSMSIKSSFHTLVAKPAYKAITDLKGKTIAVTIGAADDVVARHLLRRGGLDPSRDVTFISMAGSDSRYQSLLTGNIDATALSLPQFLMAKRQGFHLLGSAVDVLEMATVGMGTTTRKIQREREQVKKMVRSQLDTMKWFKNSKEEVVQFLRQFFALDERTAYESYEIYSQLMVEDARVLPQAIKTVLEQEGKSQMPLDKVADASIVGEVLMERK